MKEDTVYMVNKALYLIKMDSIESGCLLFDKIERMGRSIEEIYGRESEAYQLNKKYCRRPKNGAKRSAYTIAG